MTFFYCDGNDRKEFTLPENPNGGIIEAHDQNNAPFSPKRFFKPVSDFNEDIFKFSKEIYADYEKRLNGEISEIIPPEYLVRDDDNNIRGYLFSPKKEAVPFKVAIDDIKKTMDEKKGSTTEKNLYKRYAYFSFIVRISFFILKSFKKIWMRGFFLPELTENVFFVADWNNPQADPLFFFPCADDIALRYYTKGEKKSVLSVSEGGCAFLRGLLLTQELNEYLPEELKEKLTSHLIDVDDLLLSLCSFIANYQYIAAEQIDLIIKKTFSLKRDEKDENGIFQEAEETYRLYAGSKTPVYIYDPLTHRLLWLYYNANGTLYIKNESYIKCRLKNKNLEYQLNKDNKNRLYISRDALSQFCIEIQIEDDLADLDIRPHFQLIENKIVISRKDNQTCF